MQIDLGWRTFKPEWGNGDISMEIRPLKVPALLLVEPMLTAEDESPVRRTLELQQAAEGFFPDHVRNLMGMTDNEGTPIELSALWEESFFYSLTNEIVNELLRISKLDKEESKN
jgi:hypothetical protein